MSEFCIILIHGRAITVGPSGLMSVEHVLMSSYDQVLICSSREIVRDMKL